MKLLGKVRDRSVCTSQMLQNAASGDVRERGERGIETGPRILNHVVQYIRHGSAACKGRPSAAALPAAFTPQSTSFRCRFNRLGDPQALRLKASLVHFRGCRTHHAVPPCGSGRLSPAGVVAACRGAVCYVARHHSNSSPDPQFLCRAVTGCPAPPSRESLAPREGALRALVAQSGRAASARAPARPPVGCQGFRGPLDPARRPRRG